METASWATVVVAKHKTQTAAILKVTDLVTVFLLPVL